MKTELEKMFDIKFPFLTKVLFIKDIGFKCFKKGFFKGKEYAESQKIDQKAEGISEGL